MAEANPDNGGIPLADNAGSQPTLEQKFYNLYDQHVDGKEPLIISGTQYDSNVDAILQSQRGEAVAGAKERNWIKR